MRWFRFSWTRDWGIIRDQGEPGDGERAGDNDQVMERGTPGKTEGGRGLSLRTDHGTQYLSDHFLNQLKHWGINPSFTFIEQLQTNGVAERFIQTIKEQVVYGRVFKNLQEVREAVRRFVDN
jgi:transposase InsO family protein